MKQTAKQMLAMALNLDLGVTNLNIISVAEKDPSGGLLADEIQFKTMLYMMMMMSKLFCRVFRREAFACRVR